MGRLAKGYANLAYGWERNDYFPYNNGDFAMDGKDKSRFRIAAFKTGVELNTLNDNMYPSEGKEWKFNILLDHEQGKTFMADNPEASTGWHNHIAASAELLWRHYFPLHRNFKLGAYFNGLVTLQDMYQNYTAAMIHSAAFAPTPSTRNYFNVAFRSDNYGAIGLNPVWTPFGKAQLRGDFFAFCPIRDVVADHQGMAKFDGWFGHPQFIGEIAGVYNFPFASLSIYVNYLSAPARNWNFGINFGLYFQAPKLLR